MYASGRSMLLVQDQGPGSSVRSMLLGPDLVLDLDLDLDQKYI